MNFFTKLFRSRDKPSNSYHFSGWPFVFGKSVSKQMVNEFTAMQTTAVYACVRILAESIAGLPLHVYEYKGQGKERVPGHPLYFLLHDSPNPEMTSFIFRETAMIHLLLWGNSFSQIIRDGMRRVVGLYPLLPNRMSVDRDEHGELVYTYTPMSDSNPNLKSGQSIKLRREDVLHIPGLGFDGLVGYSPIAMARNAVGMTLAEAKEYLRIDTDAEDATVESLIGSAQSLCMDIARLDEETFESAGEIAKTAVLYTLAYFYEHRDEADHKALTVTLRALLMGIRKERF